MTIMADAPMAVTRPPLPRRPIPHERTPDRPTPSGTRPHPRRAAADTARHDDTDARQLLDALYREYAPMVTRVAARALRPSDRGLADDIAQETWLATWQHLLRGNELRSPAGFLAMRARRSAVDHYRLARVRREEAVDYTDGLAVARLASVIGAAA
ncbi:sigma-70 family RNA polymerase sigma factor [Streptomyces sp. AC555_RSS877]|uniref:sigma-70 family RNA polymerase sigma factor n=1 Tax=Streptomyces sp. AC555_RSS877 TaxID=2823688 RepID=UPI001C260039|nr:sigma-70 family RNA polymerase sigma factor [Streptomyces sp. AC555_RSS877]